MTQLLPQLEFTYEKFLDRSTILFGASGSGKSVIITDILYQLKPHIDQILVVSPMDKQNHMYDSIVPMPLIHYTITEELLTNLWERQLALVSIYTRANNPETLRALFDRIPNNKPARSAIDAINQKFEEHKHEVEKSESNQAAAQSKIIKMEKDCQKLILMIFKDSIGRNRSYLSRLNISENEKMSLRYYDVNPRLCVVFDDCTDLLEKLKKNQILQKIFYQGRWNYMTIIIGAHSDLALPPALKKNAFITIFTEEKSANAYFERKTNDFTRKDKTEAMKACTTAFSIMPEFKFQKLAWVRDENKFYRFTAQPRLKFRFGGSHIWEYAKKIQAKAGEINSDNKFLCEFI